jgi:Methylase involved in ubiquinone/menaquinone biosynthesis
MMNENIKSFDNKSDQYAQFRPRYPMEFYNHLLSLKEIKEKLWDCGCGNGQVSIDLVNFFDEIYATDISENQIRNGFIHKKIQYLVEPSERTSFGNSFFDIICVAQALHWFDLDKFFTEADRVLKPNGILACFGYGFFSINSEIDKIINEHLLSVVDEYWSDGNRLIMSGFKSVKFPFQEVISPKLNLVQKWNLSALLDYLDTWSAVKIYNNKFKTSVTQNLKKELNPSWVDIETRDVIFDFYSFIRKK